MIPEVEEFAKILVECVRDASVRNNDITLRPNAQSIVARRWAKAAREEDPVRFALKVIPDVVDETIFYLLQSIDEGLLKLSFTTSDGRTVDLVSQGESEMAGWYMGTGGWRTMFSKERFVDDFADLAGGA